MKEIFRKLKYSGFSHYSVSNYGKVRNNNTGRILKGHIGHSGKLMHSLHNNYQTLVKCTHIIVLDHFRKNELGKTCGIHLDNVFLNNKSSNLEWATLGEVISRKRLALETKKGRIPGITDMRKYNSTTPLEKPFRAMLSERIKDSNKYKAITLGYFKTKKEAAEAYYVAYLTKFGNEPFPYSFLETI